MPWPRLRSPQSDAPVHFWHPHRGGGTTICRLAQAAGESTDGTRNCLFNSAVDASFLTPKVAENEIEDRWTCRAQLAFVGQRRLTFVARETYLLAPPPGASGIQVGGGQGGLPPLLAPLCTGFHHITILRDPLSRIPADYCIDGPRWERRQGGKLDGGHIPRWRRGKLALRDALSDRSTSGFWDGARWSNYYVRCLLGREAFSRRVLPPGALAAANATLHLFSAVVVLEHLDAQMPLLQHTLGWPDRAIWQWRASPRSNHLTPKGCGRANWSAELERGFADVNRLDLALYGYWMDETDRRLAALPPVERIKPSPVRHKRPVEKKKLRRYNTRRPQSARRQYTRHRATP